MKRPAIVLYRPMWHLMDELREGRITELCTPWQPGFPPDSPNFRP
jgi:hypothetical protein